MRYVFATCLVVSVGSSLVRRAGAEIVYSTQERSVSALTEFDMAAQTASASDFGPFLGGVGLSVLFPTPGGGAGENAASAGIDCQIDPLAIRATGTIGGSGGLALVGGDPLQVAGEAGAIVKVQFSLLVDTPFRLFSTARPNGNLRDRFKLKLEDIDNATDVFFIDEDSPPQVVDIDGTLTAGNYFLEFQLESKFGEGATFADFALLFQVPAPGAGMAISIGGVFASRRRTR